MLIYNQYSVLLKYFAAKVNFSKKKHRILVKYIKLAIADFCSQSRKSAQNIGLQK